MIDERAQKECHYILARPIYLSICISFSSVVIPMLVGRELVHAKTATAHSCANYGSCRPISCFSID
jgi:hypothetical protein